VARWACTAVFSSCLLYAASASRFVPLPLPRTVAPSILRGTARILVNRTLRPGYSRIGSQFGAGTNAPPLRRPAAPRMEWIDPSMVDPKLVSEIVKELGPGTVPIPVDPFGSGMDQIMVDPKLVAEVVKELGPGMVPIPVDPFGSGMDQTFVDVDPKLVAEVVKELGPGMVPIMVDRPQMTEVITEQLTVDAMLVMQAVATVLGSGILAAVVGREAILRGTSSAASFAAGTKFNFDGRERTITQILALALAALAQGNIKPLQKFATWFRDKGLANATFAGAKDGLQAVDRALVVLEKLAAADVVGTVEAEWPQEASRFALVLPEDVLEEILFGTTGAGEGFLGATPSENNAAAGLRGLLDPANQPADEPRKGRKVLIKYLGSKRLPELVKFLLEEAAEARPEAPTAPIIEIVNELLVQTNPGELMDALLLSDHVEELADAVLQHGKLVENAGTVEAFLKAFLEADVKDPTITGGLAFRDTVVRLFIADKQADKLGARARRLTRLVLDSGLTENIVVAMLNAEDGKGLEVLRRILTAPCVFGILEELLDSPQGDDRLASLLNVLVQDKLGESGGNGKALMRSMFNSNQVMQIAALVSGLKLENEFGDVIVARGRDPQRGETRILQLLRIILKHKPEKQPRLVADLVTGFLSENSRGCPQPGAEQLAPGILKVIVAETVSPNLLKEALAALTEPADARRGEMLPDLLVALVATKEGQEQLRLAFRKLGESGRRSLLMQVTTLARKMVPTMLTQPGCLRKRVKALAITANMLRRAAWEDSAASGEMISKQRP